MSVKCSQRWSRAARCRPAAFDHRASGYRATDYKVKESSMLSAMLRGLGVHDVIVVGAGLAGLSAARDLAAGGADVVVARGARAPRRAGRAGAARGRSPRAARRRGRRRLDGRLPRAGRRARPHARAELHRDSTSPRLGRGRGRRRRRAALPGWTMPTRPTSARARPAFAALARGVDPADPWSHPDAERLDRPAWATGCAPRARGPG